jgi:acyl carrier protein
MNRKDATATGNHDVLAAHCLERILRYLRGTALDPSIEIPLDRSLLETGILDSFGIVDLITFLECEFGLDIPDEDVNKEKMGNLLKMANYVALKTASSAAQMRAA